MPTREHSAEQQPVGKYTRFRRMPIESNREPPPGGRGGPFPTEGLQAILGFPRRGGSEIQEMRAAASIWEFETFKDWLHNNGFEWANAVRAEDDGDEGDDDAGD